MLGGGNLSEKYEIKKILPLTYKVLIILAYVIMGLLYLSQIYNPSGDYTLKFFGILFSASCGIWLSRKKEYSNVKLHYSLIIILIVFFVLFFSLTR